MCRRPTNGRSVTEWLGTEIAVYAFHLLEEVRRPMSDNQQGIAAAPAAAGTLPPPAGAPRRGSLAFVRALSLVAAVGGFLFGFDSGVINGAVDALAGAFGTREAATGFAVASVLLGCAVGAFL